MASGYHPRRRRGGSGGSAGGMPLTPEQRDSHDLSLSPRDITRDSLVANMLLSLDQFSIDQQNQHQSNHHSHWDPSPSNHSPGPRQQQHHHQNRYQPFDGAPPPPWLTSTGHTSPSVAAAPAASRSQEHNSLHYPEHSHSYSADLDTADSSSKLSSPTDARGHSAAATASNPRLPNSSSSPSSTRQEKVEAANANLQAALESTPGKQQPRHRPPVTPPSRGASLPQAQSLDRPPRARRVPKHQQDGYHQFLTETSSSLATAFHHESDRPHRSKSAGGSSARRRTTGAAATTSARSPAQMHPPMPPSSAIDYDVDYLNEDYGAAPTPTVPAGPRRAVEAHTRAPPEPATPRTLERKRSSSRTLSLRSAPGKNRHAATPWDQQQPPPPMPSAEEFEAAPAPSVGYRKAKEDQHRAKSSHAAFPHQQHPDLPQQPQKEKPGFFRRVFGGGGSSKNMLAPTEQFQQSNSTRPPSSPSRNERPPSGKLTKEQSKSISAPPSRDTSSSHSQQPPPVPPLQKKTSSFFRRRKKSVVDDAPPLPSHVPPVPNMPLTTLTNETSLGIDDPSPVSSLRQALDPYLRNSAGSAKAIGASKPTALTDITNIVADSGEDDEPRPEFKREFSPDYDPSPNAKIRSVTNDAENSRDSPTRHAASPATKKTKSAAYQTFLDLDNGSDDENASRYGNRRSRSELSPAADSESASVSQKDTSKDDTIRASKMPPRALDQPSPGTSRSRSNLRLPSDGNRSASAGTMSTETDYKSATSAPPSVRVEDLDETDSSKGVSIIDAMEAKGLDEPLFVVGEPTEDDRLKAKKIYDGLEDFIQQDKAAAWMGEEGPIRKRTLQAYMELYSFTDQSIVSRLAQHLRPSDSTSRNPASRSYLGCLFQEMV